MTYDSFSLQFWCKNWMHCEDNVKYRPLVRKKARRTWRCKKLPSNNKLYNKTMSSSYHRELKTFSEASCADSIYTGEKLILQLLLLRIRTFYLYWCCYFVAGNDTRILLEYLLHGSSSALTLFLWGACLPSIHFVLFPSWLNPRFAVDSGMPKYFFKSFLLLLDSCPIESQIMSIFVHILLLVARS